MIDIRRALESIAPDSKWDFSVPNEGGTESQYNAITWTDERTKPAWAEIVSVADGFAAADIAAKRLGMSVGPLQLRRALREVGMYAAVVAYVETADEEVQEALEYATEYRRDDPLFPTVQAAMELTDEEIDNLFALAATK